MNLHVKCYCWKTPLNKLFLKINIVLLQFSKKNPAYITWKTHKKITV